MNDLPGFLMHDGIISYDDDTQILDIAMPDEQNLCALKLRLEQSLNALHGLFRANSLKANKEKRTFIVLSEL